MYVGSKYVESKYVESKYVVRKYVESMLNLNYMSIIRFVYVFLK